MPLLFSVRLFFFCRRALPLVLCRSFSDALSLRLCPPRLPKSMAYLVFALAHPRVSISKLPSQLDRS